MRLLPLFILLSCSGCTIAGAKWSDGWTFIARFGYDTSIGELKMERNDAKIHMRKVNSEATAVEALNEAIRRIPVAP